MHISNDLSIWNIFQKTDLVIKKNLQYSPKKMSGNPEIFQPPVESARVSALEPWQRHPWCVGQRPANDAKWPCKSSA